jgi:hypothetical protein
MVPIKTHKNHMPKAYQLFRPFTILCCLFIQSCTGNSLTSEFRQVYPTQEFISTQTKSLKPTFTAISTPSIINSPTVSSQEKEDLSPENHSQSITLTPEFLDWKDLPVLPEVSDKTKEIYKRGQKAGFNRQAFSKIGDCESRTTWFLADFDMGQKYYNLGPYNQLQDTINYFKGSYDRLSLAARPGFSVASLISPYWSDPQFCHKDETPLACEFRIHRPAFILVSIGTNDVAHPESFEKNLRKVIDYSIQEGVVPILATKADNLEGDHHLNATIAALSQEYQIPLWNFWRSVQSLPDVGLQSDKAHLTWSPNDFSDPENLKRAWPVRNLTALQVLDKIRLVLQ